MVNQKAFHFLSVLMRDRDIFFLEVNPILFKKVSKDKVDEISFHLEDNNGHLVNFNGESLTYTGMLLKT